MRLAHFGTFDVKNYGDSLFPLLVQQRLGGVFDEIVYVSPRGGQAYVDVPPAISTRQFVEQGSHVDAVIVGGGNILHARNSPLDEYAATPRTAYAGLWGTAAHVAIRNDAHLFWNSPGIPRRPGPLTSRSMRSALRVCSYASVRDRTSWDFLPSPTLRIVPDTALDIAGVLGHPVRTGRDYIAVHVNSRYLDSSVDALAATLDRIAASIEADIVLIAIGECHGDGPLARAVEAQLVTRCSVLDDISTVTEIAHCIASAKAYLGSSLHGYITACSYGVPAAIVAKDSMHHKFSGFLDHVQSPHSVYGSWSDLGRDVAAEPDVDTWARRHRADTGAALRRIDSHWQTILDVVAEPPARHHGATAFPHWPHDPRSIATLNVVEQVPARAQSAVGRGAARLRSVVCSAPPGDAE